MNMTYVKKVARDTVMVSTAVLMLAGCGSKKTETKKKTTSTEPKQEELTKIDLVDTSSAARPYMVSINNTPVAVKVQEGLTKAYMIYEIPTEGYTSRLLALFKEAPEDLKIGTIRSARHNMLDFAYEHDAIFVHYGQSHYAKDQIEELNPDKVSGLMGDGKYFFRQNPEHLASEHTAYTTFKKVYECVKAKKYRTEASSPNKTFILNYNEGDVDLSSNADVKDAKEVKINYGGNYTTFKYDASKKMYAKWTNGKPNKDHKTKEQLYAKNIVVEKVKHQMMPDNQYWNLTTVGNGSGYYITNGKSVPITWSKASRKAQTIYKTKDGKKVELSNGVTYVEVQGVDKKTEIK